MQVILHIIVYVLSVPDMRAECIPPVITVASGQSIESIFVSWLDAGNEPGTLYALELVPAGSSPTGMPTIDSMNGVNATATGLQHGTDYEIYIRSICPEGPSDWGNAVYASTHIENGSCGVVLSIPDDNCPMVRSFAIAVSGYDNLNLGEEVFVSSVDLIVEHPWMADLTLELRNPSGTSTLLMADRGVGVQNIGSPGDTTCAGVLRFSMAACTDLTDLESGQTGDVLPDGSLNELHDEGPVNGTWYLDVCDKASDDIGTLRFLQLNFTENACDFPPTLSISQVLDTIATLNGLNDENCDTVVVAVWDVNAPEDTTFLRIPCDANEILIPQLSPAQSYTYQAYKECGDHTSAWACPQTISTTCDVLSLWSHFDDNADCVADCGSDCPVTDSVWRNADQDAMDWTVYQGATPTEFTGPGGTRLAGGKYLFTETSGEACQNGSDAVLMSRCLQISGSEDGCDMSFWYHMHGASTGSLNVSISVDGGSSWEELLTISGDQGDMWHQASINLHNYDDALALMRIRALSGPGFLGDIAIDDIMFFGTTADAGIERTYYHDADMDGHGNLNDTICVCSLLPPSGYTTNTTDCDDTDPDVNPDAEELPCNLKDDNCNNEVDEGINPDPVVYNIVMQQDASCTGIDDGQIEITLSGGLPPYSIAWNNGGDSAFISDLSPGEYQATITDSNGCIILTEIVEIESLVLLEYFVVAIGDPSCIGQSDGFISGIMQGGTLPYTFEWSNGDTTTDINNLPDGTYQVTVTDAEGCWLISETVTLEATSTFSVNILQFRHVTCNGGNNGSIRIAASGGAIPPISYLWSNGDTTGLTTGLSTGAYTCTITDSLGCMLVAGPYQINEPAILEAQIVSAVPPLCNSSDDGSIALSVNGGTPPYFYIWSHGEFSQEVTGLTAGEYSVYVSDLHGCDTVLFITLESPDMLQAELDTVINVQCPGDNTGIIEVNASGGIPPYRFDWSTGSTDSASLRDLPTGVYAVTLSDASGCKSSIRDIAITALHTPLAVTSETLSNVNCHGDSTGVVAASVAGGTPPYWFNWSSGKLNMSMDGSDTLSVLASGNYQVTVTDLNGCTGISGKTPVTQPDRLAFILEVIRHNSCFGDSTGGISIHVEGGTIPYHYVWSQGDTTEDVGGLKAGTYYLTVTDKNGCEIVTQGFAVNQPDSVVIDFITTDEDGMMANGTAEVLVSGGTPPYTYEWGIAAGGQTTPLAVNLASGTYPVRITDDAGCEYFDSVFVDRITAVSEVEDGGIKVYPNPARRHFIVESEEEITDMAVFGLEGRRLEIFVDPVAHGIVKVDIRNLVTGLYIVRVNGKVCKLVVE